MKVIHYNLCCKLLLLNTIKYYLLLNTIKYYTKCKYKVLWNVSIDFFLKLLTDRQTNGQTENKKLAFWNLEWLQYVSFTCMTIGKKESIFNIILIILKAFFNYLYVVVNVSEFILFIYFFCEVLLLNFQYVIKQKYVII